MHNLFFMEDAGSFTRGDHHHDYDHQSFQEGHDVFYPVRTIVCCLFALEIWFVDHFDFGVSCSHLSTFVVHLLICI